MITMSKFNKRLRKASKNLDNALVVGTGFGQLPEVLTVYNTVFVISPTPPNVKSKNLIYRDNFDNLEQMGDLAAVLIDLDQLHRLESLAPLMNRLRMPILVEGNEPIDRTKSTVLYAHNYKCIDLHGLYHVWKQ